MLAHGGYSHPAEQALCRVKERSQRRYDFWPENVDTRHMHSQERKHG